MYSKDEIKQIRADFWDGFQNYSSPKRRKLGKPKQWVMQNTGIKAIDLKFHIDDRIASVGIDVVSKSLDSKVAYWNKLIGLKTLLNEELKEEVIWDDMFTLPSGKDIIRISVIKENVGLKKKECWQDVYAFFFENMIIFENFLEEYKEIIRIRQGEI